MTKNNLNSIIKDSLKKAMQPKIHTNAKIKTLVKDYQKEAWKSTPNFGLMQSITKEIKIMKIKKGKW